LAVPLAVPFAVPFAAAVPLDGLNKAPRGLPAIMPIKFPMGELLPDDETPFGLLISLRRPERPDEEPDEPFGLLDEPPSKLPIELIFGRPTPPVNMIAALGSLFILGIKS